MTDALRLAFGTLSIIPVRLPRDVDHRTWGRSMTGAPVVGVTLGAAAAAAAIGILELGASPLLAGVASVASLALLTRALHLDGLADVADGLGSGRSPVDARAVMKRSDIGPFGVVTLVLVLLTQIAALSEVFAGSSWIVQAVAVVGAAVLSRAALTWSCRNGVRAASSGGLGRQVAGSVSVASALAVLVVSIGLVGASGALVDARFAGAVAISAVAAIAVAELWRRHCTRRFDGITGDVLGSVEQVAFTVYLLLLAVLA